MLSKGDDGERLAFEVSHYAGIVMYDAGGFCDKNGDKVLGDQRDAILTSASPLVTALFDERPDIERAPSSMLNAAAADGGGGGRRRARVSVAEGAEGPPRVGSVFANNPSGGSSVSEASRRGSVQTPARAGAKTIAAHFSKQLASLMASLDATAPQFVRCIKPNALKTAGILQPQLVLEQLRYSGVFEATAIKKSGFPFRATHQAFVARYRCAADPEELGQYSRRARPPKPTGARRRGRCSRRAQPSGRRDAPAAGQDVLCGEGAESSCWGTRGGARASADRRAFLARNRRRAAAARAACDAAVAASDVDALTAALDLARALPTEYAWPRGGDAAGASRGRHRRLHRADAAGRRSGLRASAALAEYDGQHTSAAHSELHSKATTMIDGVARRFGARGAQDDHRSREARARVGARRRAPDVDGRDAATAASADQELLGGGGGVAENHRRSTASSAPRSRRRQARVERGVRARARSLLVRRAANLARRVGGIRRAHRRRPLPAGGCAGRARRALGGPRGGRRRLVRWRAQGD